MMDNVAIRQMLNQSAEALKAGRAAIALEKANAILSVSPDIGPAQYLKGGAEAALGNTEAAIGAFRQALIIDSSFVPARTALANLQARTGNIAEAVSVLDGHSGTPIPDLLFRAAELRLQLNEHLRAEKDCERLLQIAPQDSRGYVLRGRIDIEASRYSSAERVLRDATVKFPTSATAYFYLARACSAQGKTKIAREALENAARLRPNAPSIAQEQARLAYTDGDADLAISLLESAMRLEPLNPSLHRDLSQIRYMRNDGDHLRSFRDILVKRPDDVGMLSMFAGVARAGDHPEAALPQLDAAIRAGIDHALIWDARAQIHVLLGQYDEALSDTDRAGFATGLTHGVQLNRCSAYLSANLPEKALPIAAQLVEDAPQDQLAIAYRLSAMNALDDPAADEFTDPETLTGQQMIDCPDGFDSLEAFNTALKKRLLELHNADREPIDQSLRGGTQTELFSILEEDPLIRQLSDKLLVNVKRFADSLPRKEGHPFLGNIPDEFHFSGIWSVCLRSGGHHVSHVHPEGWLSSAYYVSLPSSARDQTSGEGALNVGKPPMKALWDRVPGTRRPPREGYLTLFPSYLWHGTEPFESEEPRITVAFDIAPRRY